MKAWPQPASDYVRLVSADGKDVETFQLPVSKSYVVGDAILGYDFKEYVFEKEIFNLHDGHRWYIYKEIKHYEGIPGEVLKN